MDFAILNIKLCISFYDFSLVFLVFGKFFFGNGVDLGENEGKWCFFGGTYISG